ncbi:integrase [Legionella israelensis]|uniref:Integrase n=2 Tax=Legionella israelensis TaxID=454 RepID=A0AAX1EHW0_9GAMM|nr:integrase [Legionella israelensis]
MMRKQTLRQTANRYFKLDNRGSFKSKKQRAHVIHKMIDDLYIIGDVPSSWQALKPTHIHQLIAHRKKKKIKNSTIMNHLTIIRRYLHSIDCMIAGIDNKSLQISKHRKRRRKIKVSHDVWANWNDDIARLVMALQTDFGLKLKEAIHIKPKIHVKDHAIWVTRNIAFNSRDRTIPVRNEKQKKIIAEFIKLSNCKNLIDSYGYGRIISSWQIELKNHSLPKRKSWRYLYAQQMYQYLHPIVGRYQAKWLIRDEMGIQSRNTLWRYLNE